jgi:hypothetical protein
LWIARPRKPILCARFGVSFALEFHLLGRQNINL